MSPESALGSRWTKAQRPKWLSSTGQSDQAGFGLNQRALIDEILEDVTHLGDLLVPWRGQ